MSTTDNTSFCWDMEGLLACPLIGPIAPLDDIDMMILPESDENNNDDNKPQHQSQNTSSSLDMELTDVEYTDEMWMDHLLELDQQEEEPQHYSASKNDDSMMDDTQEHTSSSSSSETPLTPYSKHFHYHTGEERHPQYRPHGDYYATYQHSYDYHHSTHHRHHHLPPTCPQHEHCHSPSIHSPSSQQHHPSLPINCRDNDVICGRAQEIRTFLGNERFRQVIEEYRGDYHAAQRKSAKSRVSTKIYHMITQRGGRFWDKKARSESDMVDEDAAGDSSQRTSRRSTNKKVWYELSQEKAIAKISQALRNGTRPVRGSMSSQSPERKHDTSSSHSVAAPTKLVISIGNTSSSSDTCNKQSLPPAWTRSTSTSTPLSAGSDHSSRTR